jgi:hypothetical protein
MLFYGLRTEDEVSRWSPGLCGVSQLSEQDEWREATVEIEKTVESGIYKEFDRSP